MFHVFQHFCFQTNPTTAGIFVRQINQNVLTHETQDPSRVPRTDQVNLNDVLEPVETAARRRAAVFPAKTGPES